MLLHGFRSDQKGLWPKMSAILKHRLESSLEDLESNDLLVETNNPKNPICLVHELLLFEHLYLNRSAIRCENPRINWKLKPISTERVYRHLSLAGGLDFYKLRKVTRAHVVFHSNLKLRVIDENGKVVYGDASEEH